MTRKDYEAIVFAIHESVTDVKKTGLADDALFALSIVANNLATSLGQDNPRFNRERFLAACGVNNG